MVATRELPQPTAPASDLPRVKPTHDTRASQDRVAIKAFLPSETRAAWSCSRARRRPAAPPAPRQWRPGCRELESTSASATAPPLPVSVFSTAATAATTGEEDDTACWAVEVVVEAAERERGEGGGEEARPEGAAAARAPSRPPRGAAALPVRGCCARRRAERTRGRRQRTHGV